MREADYVAGNPNARAAGVLVVVSGCSGGGKSTLLEEMERRGYPVFPEPGRQVVKEELAVGGDALPWADAERFMTLCASRAMYFFNVARPAHRQALFDRSIVDVAAGYRRMGRVLPPPLAAALDVYRYAPSVFLVPPWRALFATDGERRHTYEEAVAEYETLVDTFGGLGYDVVVIPQVGVRERADWLDRELSARRTAPAV